MEEKKNNRKLLLHICCIGCGAYVSRVLSDEDFDVVLYFYNPNIFPAAEYEKRLETTRRIAREFKLALVEEEYDHGEWLKKVKGLETEPERGKRCLVCYFDRLKKTALYAKKNKFDYFSSTLTISPHKDSKSILKFGNELSAEYEVDFLARDYKKRDGFKKSIELSRELDLYRQNYCGCEFSRREVCENCQLT